MVEQRINSEVTYKLKCYVKPMKDPLVNGIREPHEIKKKLLQLTSVGIEPTTTGLDLPLPLLTKLRGRTEKVGDDFRW